MQISDPILRLAELIILGLTLAVTLVTALAVYHQTSKYFTSERTSYYIERFNRTEIVEARDVTDRWLETKESPKELYDRAKDRTSLEGKEAGITLRNIRVFTNFFQEIGAAMKHETLDDEYLWDVFGGIVRRYGLELKPFVDETRIQLKRPAAYRDFTELVGKMEQLEKKYGSK